MFQTKPLQATNIVRSWALKKVLLPSGDAMFGQRMMSRLRVLEKAQWWDEDRLRAHRAQSLSRLIETAYDEVPFYRDVMDQAGVKPADIVEVKDLSRLPVVTKRMLRAAYPVRTIRRTGQRTYDARSSGSTGQNMIVREDAETAGAYRASFLLALDWAGWHIGEAHVQTGVTPHRSMDRRLKDLLLRCHYVQAFDLRDEHLDSVLQFMDAKGINHLWGYPGSLYHLARRAAARGWNRPLRSIVTWGDNLYTHYRKLIESSFKTRVFDTYGCGEGFQIAAQCGAGMNYHIHALDVVVELLDDRGQPVGQNESGNVVVTRLHPGPMPLIRYQVGDVAMRGPTARCSCGRTFELLGGIEGRDTDVVLTPSGNRLIVHFFTGILEFFPEIDTFQIVQEDPSSIHVKVVPSPAFTNSSDWHRRVIDALKARGAADLDIHLEPVTDIPVSASGKRRFVINTCSKEGP